MNVWTITSFIGFTLLVAVISWWYTRKEDLTTRDGFFLGGRSLSGVSIGFSILLTNWSAEQLIGLNGQGYSVGLSNMGWAVTAAIAFVITAIVFLPMFIKKGITTIPDFIEARFGGTARNFIAWLFLINVAVVFLPTIVYAGALGMSKIFNVADIFGINEDSALLVSIFFITVIGGIYAIFGGLKAVVISDTINGFGFFVGSIFILIMGLIALGSGSMANGVEHLIVDHPQMLNAVTSPKVSVPFGAIFTGMVLINIYFVCTNQIIIQRALGAKSVAEGQKGVLFAGVVKIISILILIVPGIIAFHLYGNENIRPDEAYPILTSRLLPSYMVGFFGAVLFGAIISTFNSTINSCSTIFAINIYTPLKKGDVSNQQSVSAGRIFGTGLAIFSALGAPFIQYAPQGLYLFMQEFNALFSIPMLLMVVVAIFFKKATVQTTISGMLVYIALYLFFKFGYTGWDLHFLHKTAIYFFCGLAVTLLLTHYFPSTSVEVESHNTAKVNIENWKHLRIASIMTLVLMVATYVIASPLGIVAPISEVPMNLLYITLASIAAVIITNSVVKKVSQTYFS
ncbi:solute:sodium symporter family transporter [Marinomonas sp. 15G1-11]|uniref:Solute:sodium symporter family transporter n=1 Tax=Marinomonas phaeophyticola TaxID=3004091 RepID=A0ABT4JV09_9GAMM|nr:solute:sodium symporter family transporter [Marinomonas sp. 15G1-11]MCZ2722180.1 solute:sodium symporter family transporter [Marinomonas sp. 15G1-11]